MSEHFSVALPWLLRLLVYPLLEEYVFRAGLLQWLDTRWPQWRGWRTNALVSIVFAAAHLWTWPLAHSVAVFFPSLALGWIWQRKKQLWLCVAVHSLFNALGIVLYEHFPWSS